MLKRFFTISKWVGPDYDDYKLLSTYLNVRDPHTIMVMFKKTENLHLYRISEWDKDPNLSTSSVIGSINIEEFLNNTKASFAGGTP